MQRFRHNETTYESILLHCVHHHYDSNWINLQEKKRKKIYVLLLLYNMAMVAEQMASCWEHGFALVQLLLQRDNWKHRKQMLL